MSDLVRLLMIEDDLTHARLAAIALQKSQRSRYEVTKWEPLQPAKRS